MLTEAKSVTELVGLVGNYTIVRMLESVPGATGVFEQAARVSAASADLASGGDGSAMDLPAELVPVISKDGFDEGFRFASVLAIVHMLEGSGKYDDLFEDMSDSEREALDMLLGDTIDRFAEFMLEAGIEKN